MTILISNSLSALGPLADIANLGLIRNMISKWSYNNLYIYGYENYFSENAGPA